jgi:hypothetical protein
MFLFLLSLFVANQVREIEITQFEWFLGGVTSRQVVTEDLGNCSNWSLHTHSHNVINRRRGRTRFISRKASEVISTLLIKLGLPLIAISLLNDDVKTLKSV